MTRNANNAKNNTQSNEMPTIVLKTILNDICNDVKRDRKIEIDINAKRVRDVMRREFASMMSHVHNSSWIFTSSQRDVVYDRIRVMHDAKYHETIERRAKRNAKSNDAPKSTRKRNTKSNDVVNVDDATTTNVDVNA